MAQTLLGTDTRCQLRSIQSEYAKKYTEGSLLEHEEDYILKSFKLLFEDAKKYFTNKLLMFDAYYLTHDEKINNISNKLSKQNNSYAALVNSFYPKYSEWIDKVKRRTEENQFSIISVSHELIEKNKKTGLCFFKTKAHKKVNEVPIDCQFFNLANVTVTSFTDALTLENIFEKDSDAIAKKSFEKFCSELDIKKNKKNGIARTILLYSTFLHKKNNSFVYFIRPRIAHGRYNGSLVLILNQELSEADFNSLSSFLNEILCETAIARFVTETREKAVAETIAAYEEFLWAGKRSKSMRSTETEARQRELIKAINFCLSNEGCMDEINRSAINWSLQFCKCVVENNNSTFHFAEPLAEFDCYKVKNPNHSDADFLKIFHTLFKARKIMHLLVKLRDDGAIPFVDAQNQLKQVLPNVVLNCLRNGKYVTLTLSPQNYRKFISQLGLSQAQTVDHWLKLNLSQDFMHSLETNWLNEIKNAVTAKIVQRDFSWNGT